MAWSATQRYVAEFLGTFLLLVGVTGAVLVATTHLSGGPGGYGGGELVIIVSISIGLALVAGIYAFGDISGGHFNPAVSISMAVSGRLPWRDVLPYIVAQVLGALTGVLAVAGFAYGYNTAWRALVNASFGSQGDNVSNNVYAFPLGAVLLFEIVVTFLFVLVIQRVTRGDSSARNLAPLTIGFTLLMANLIGIGIDGASFNPARSFAPAILSQIWQPPGGAWALAGSWIFWVAPIIGGILAAIVELMLLQPKGAANTATPPAPPPTG